jgi:succinate-semialdehyde dehydrogenase/glutarate-semialdehyde dehydrogenase
MSAEAVAETARLFIGGNWVAGEAGLRPVINPASAAIDAASAARLAWRNAMPGDRGGVLVRAAGLLRERLDGLARQLTLEQGKTLTESRGEITRAVETLAWNGEEAARIAGRSVPGRTPGSTRRRQPVPLGVVAAFTAWNFPAVLATRKLGAALAAGCTVVLKAAEEAPYTAAAIVTALADAGLPAGVVNLVFGDPPAVARHLLAHPAIRKVTFTGSTAVGREIARLAAADLKRCTFELGLPAGSTSTAHATRSSSINSPPRRGASWWATDSIPPPGWDLWPIPGGWRPWNAIAAMPASTVPKSCWAAKGRSGRAGSGRRRSSAMSQTRPLS